MECPLIALFTVSRSSCPHVLINSGIVNVPAELEDKSTKVAQKVMPHIFLLRNYLFRMYEIHAQYNRMFPLHVIFPHNLHLRIWPYSSMKQGHACLPCTGLFPVHVAMSSLHESWFCHLLHFLKP